MIWVSTAEYVEGHRLRVGFNDGSAGVVDLRQTILTDSRPVFRALQDIGAFRRFRLEHDTVVWENGLDLAPEFLHRLLETQAAPQTA